MATIPLVNAAPASPGSPYPLTQAEANAFNALIANQASIVGYTQAAVTSANRAQGAKDAGNAFWQAKQTQQAQLYTTNLGVLFSKEETLLATLQSALASAGVSLSLPVSDVFNFQTQIASNGLPAPFAQALQTLGADQGSIDLVASFLIGLNGSNASGMFPNILTSSNIIGPLQSASVGLSGPLSAITSGLAYSRVSQTFNGSITIQNVSSATIPGPFYVLLTSLTTGVSLLNATGTFNASPYLLVPNTDSLSPGQSATVATQFSDPSFTNINFTPMIDSGSLR